MQTSFIQLDRVIQVTNRRVNALELIVIPNIENVIKYIDQELEEQERESKYIAKKVVQMKNDENEEVKNVDDEEDDIYKEDEIQEEYFMEEYEEQSDDDLF